MHAHVRLVNEIPLVPDSELLEMMKEAQRQVVRTKGRAGDRAGRRQEQLAKRLEALNRELKARGIGCPPWWAERT